VRFACALALLIPLAAQAAPAGGDQALSKKALFLRDKAERKDVRARRPPRPTAPLPILTLHNVWTSESLPVVLSSGPEPFPAQAFDELTRCHFTNQEAQMDPRLFQTLLRAAAHFRTRYIEIVSGFRAPKYQLMLRKKGHEVARDSQHPLGHAVDFRIPEIPTRKLLRWVKSLHLGGVGYYPESHFVHADVGRIRFWRGH
jgi:uncharacterized protein YcbK (DUF882 family)